MSTKIPKDLGEFQALISVMKTLVGPNGCPWDKEQNHRSLIPCLIEETHEVVEAIESQDYKNLKEELGDLLLQVVFHAQLAEQESRFNISDVIAALNEKLIRRHPHVFGNAKAQTADEGINNWDQIKKLEKNGQKSEDLGGPKGAPALQRSQKIGEKSRRAKFDWKETGEVEKKLEEELNELHQSIQAQDAPGMEHEMGDVFFTLVQLARHLKIDSEASLRKANRRFELRYFKMQELVQSKGLSWQELTDSEKEDFWQQAKRATIV